MSLGSFALIVHDLKNALGVLESELSHLSAAPSQQAAAQAHEHCAALRRQFVQFLTLYGRDEALTALCEDESPAEVLGAIQRSSQSTRQTPGTPEVVLGERKAEPAFWYFDRRLVHLALDAALHNAMRFARGSVTLSAREEQGFLVFVVDDDGPGLGAVDPSVLSTGLGTDLCRAVALAHRCADREGRIELFNRPEGGARFELWLP